MALARCGNQLGTKRRHASFVSLKRMLDYYISFHYLIAHYLPGCSIQAVVSQRSRHGDDCGGLSEFVRLLPFSSLWMFID